MLVFWVISVYFNIRNTLPKSGTFLLGHPVYQHESVWDNTSAIGLSSGSILCAAIVSDVTWCILCSIFHYGFRSSGIWCWVVGWDVPGVLNDRSAFVFKGHGLFHWGCLIPWRIQNHSPWHTHTSYPRRLEPSVQCCETTMEHVSIFWIWTVWKWHIPSHNDN